MKVLMVQDQHYFGNNCTRIRKSLIFHYYLPVHVVSRDIPMELIMFHATIPMVPMVNTGEFWNNGWFSDGKIVWIGIIYPDELIDFVLESNGKK